MKEKQTKNDFIKIWQTANLTGAAFSGKLKALSHYIKDDPQRIGQKLTRAQMDDFDTRLAAKGGSEYDSGNT